MALKETVKVQKFNCGPQKYFQWSYSNVENHFSWWWNSISHLAMRYTPAFLTLECVWLSRDRRQQCLCCGRIWRKEFEKVWTTVPRVKVASAQCLLQHSMTNLKTFMHFDFLKRMKSYEAIFGYLGKYHRLKTRSNCTFTF